MANVSLRKGSAMKENKRTIEIVDEEEFIVLMHEAMMNDQEELDEMDFEDERLIECRIRR